MVTDFGWLDMLLASVIIDKCNRYAQNDSDWLIIIKMNRIICIDSFYDVVD